MKWFLSCATPAVPPQHLFFPFSIGRVGCNFNLSDSTVSRQQCHLELQRGVLFVINDSMGNPTLVDGTPVTGAAPLTLDRPHVLEVGSSRIAISPKRAVPLDDPLLAPTTLPYYFSTDGQTYGPCSESDLVVSYESGTLRRDSLVWQGPDITSARPATDWLDFGPDDAKDAMAPLSDTDGPVWGGRVATAEEEAPVPGETFLCPYCRTVPHIEDVLSISVSAELLGDPVLGPADSQRFLPARFTANGLAIDALGGVCTELACPHCHMRLPQALLDTPQIVMSVVGAPSAGKSFFLASAIWQCRQLLSRRFGVQFMDLDPGANAWINQYEEKLFFETGDNSLRKIEKTDVLNADITRSVVIDGQPLYLPLPSFFKLRSADGADSALVVYDSAGENFQTSADDVHSLVTRNILGSDVLYFLFDPSADPRIAPLLDRGGGTASRGLQRQEILLSEMAARIRRHLGNRSESQLSRPLLFGVPKADMLRRYLPLDRSPYRELPPDASGRVRHALDMDALREISETTEAFLDGLVPEAVATAHDIARDVWFLPMSALGHNPMQEGVHPSMVKPVWAELPIVFTLAHRGLIPAVGTAKP